MSAVMDQETANRRSRGLDRAFEMLDFLRAQRKPLRPNEIAAHLGAPRSSIYELVNLLVKHGVLEYVGKDGQVFLGRKLYFLGAAYAEHFDLMRECDAVLARLAEETRETAQLCMLDGNKYTVALMKEGIRPFRISSNVGEALPIPWTASGRLLVSHMTDQQIRDFIPAEDFILPNGDPRRHTGGVLHVRQPGRQLHPVFRGPGLPDGQHLHRHLVPRGPQGGRSAQSGGVSAQPDACSKRAESAIAGVSAGTRLADAPLREAPGDAPCDSSHHRPVNLPAPANRRRNRIRSSRNRRRSTSRRSRTSRAPVLHRNRRLRNARGPSRAAWVRGSSSRRNASR